MNPEIMQWAQTPEAQPYLQKFQPQQSQPQMGGYGMGGGYDGYASMLKWMYDNSAGNPKAQNAYVGEYLDMMNPVNQYSFKAEQEKNDRYGTEMLLNTALSIISSEDPAMQQVGQTLLLEALGNSYPEIAGSLIGTGYDEPQTYEGIKRQSAKDIIGGEDVQGLSKDQYDWYNFLANASDSQVREYDEAKKGASRIFGGFNKFSDEWAGTGVWNPFNAAFWSPEKAARSRTGYSN